MKITSTIHVLPIDFSVPLPSGAVTRTARVTMLCHNRVTLIDSGVKGCEQDIFNYLKRLGRSPEEIDTLILTHSHPDHIGAARAIVEATGCRVVAHEAERDWIEDVILQARQRPVPGFHTLVGGSLKIDHCVSDGEELALDDGMALTVLHTPGHSAGSISLWQQEMGILICGDAVPVPGEMPVFEDYTKSLASLERLAQLPAIELISAWEAPLRGADITACLADSRDWLRHLYEMVWAVAGDQPQIAPTELCAAVVTAAKLPAFAANPLVAKSIMACLSANRTGLQ